MVVACGYGIESLLDHFFAVGVLQLHFLGNCSCIAVIPYILYIIIIFVLLPPSMIGAIGYVLYQQSFDTTIVLVVLMVWLLILPAILVIF